MQLRLAARGTVDGNVLEEIEMVGWSSQLTLIRVDAYMLCETYMSGSLPIVTKLRP